MCDATLPFIACHRLPSPAIACHHWHLPLRQTLSAGIFSTFPLRSEIPAPFFRDHNLHTITITTSLLPSRQLPPRHHATSMPRHHVVTNYLRTAMSMGTCRRNSWRFNNWRRNRFFEYLWLRIPWLDIYIYTFEYLCLNDVWCLA